jgi:mercuric reductase
VQLSVDEAIRRLDRQFPIRRRRAVLPSPQRAAHRAIIDALIREGKPLGHEQLARCLGQRDAAASIALLATNDLIVLDDAGRRVVGAYPLTTESTPHQVTFNDHQLFAMCALDALAVASLFQLPVTIRSRCHRSDTPIRILQGHEGVREVAPQADVQVGIRWQVPQGPAAHSMCREMVFLRDVSTARQWQRQDPDAISLFHLDEGVRFAEGFFSALFA